MNAALNAEPVDLAEINPSLDRLVRSERWNREGILMGEARGVGCGWTLVSLRVPHKAAMEAAMKMTMHCAGRTLALALLLAGAGNATANFTNLHNFSATSASSPSTNSDGAQPRAGLILANNRLYGVASAGGAAGYGIVFGLNPDGSGFTNLVNFTGQNGSSPYAKLVWASNTLYGTTSGGGTGSYGAVFKLNEDGTGYTNFLNFTYNTSQSGVYGGVALSGNTVYGATEGGGTGFAGTIYKANADGTGFSDIYSLASGGIIEGMNPDCTLVLSGTVLYGTATKGGSGGNGTVFRVNTDGTGFTNLHSFSASSATFPQTNSDGGGPGAGLVLSGGTLYGTARFRGTNSSGSIFKLNTDGGGFGVLHSFSSKTYDPSLSTTTNSEGGAPWGGLILSGNTLYGTTAAGGALGSGVLFKLSTDGTSFNVLYTFSATSTSFPYTNSDGSSPYGELLLVNNTLYGTTQSGGTAGNGTVFAFTLPSSGAQPIPLAIQIAGDNAILNWSDSASAFSLQSSARVNGPYTNLVGVSSPYTNPVAGSARFFRLKSN